MLKRKKKKDKFLSWLTKTICKTSRLIVLRVKLALRYFHVFKITITYVLFIVNVYLMHSLKLKEILRYIYMKINYI